ncbi:MAG: hypothetical protein PF495_02030 [Spirochaetales bacterium]|nr:hypothetical protein [Spirochaetales bacterium]
MATSRRIEKVCRKFNINRQPSDFEYWQSQPYEKRLAVLEEIRKEYHGGDDASESGLQRVYRIIKQ